MDQDYRELPETWDRSDSRARLVHRDPMEAKATLECLGYLVPPVDRDSLGNLELQVGPETLER